MPYAAEKNVRVELPIHNMPGRFEDAIKAEVQKSCSGVPPTVAIQFANGQQSVADTGFSMNGEIVSVDAVSAPRVVCVQLLRDGRVIADRDIWIEHCSPEEIAAIVQTVTTFAAMI